MASSTSPAVVATVLGLVPLRRLVRCGVRDVALRADHGGGLGVDQARAARPGADAGRPRREQDRGRQGLPGSAWTRQTGSWRASWVHSLVNLGRRTGAPTMPPPVPTTPGGSPAGIATTLRDAPDHPVHPVAWTAGWRPGQDLTADPDRSSVWAAASLRFDPAQVPNAPRVPCVSVGSGSSPVGLAPGARNGALGGSFRSALDRAAARTAQSRGNSRAHPGCRPERSSQSARTQKSPGLPTVLGALRKPIPAAT